MVTKSGVRRLGSPPFRPAGKGCLRRCVIPNDRQSSYASPYYSGSCCWFRIRSISRGRENYRPFFFFFFFFFPSPWRQQGMVRWASAYTGAKEDRRWETGRTGLPDPERNMHAARMRLPADRIFDFFWFLDCREARAKRSVCAEQQKCK